MRLCLSSRLGPFLQMAVLESEFSWEVSPPRSFLRAKKSRGNEALIDHPERETTVLFLKEPDIFRGFFF